LKSVVCQFGVRHAKRWEGMRVLKSAEFKKREVVFSGKKGQKGFNANPDWGAKVPQTRRSQHQPAELGEPETGERKRRDVRRGLLEGERKKNRTRGPENVGAPEARGQNSGGGKKTIVNL